VTALLISAISYIPMHAGTAGGLGFLLLVPMSVASLAAGLSFTLVGAVSSRDGD
jgi:hypothetical protein